MLEKLAGRLRWKQTASSIRVNIPARMDWPVVVGAPIVSFFAIFGLIIAGTSFLEYEHVSFYQWFSVLCFLVIGSMALIVLLWNLAGKTIVLLDSRELTIARRVLGVSWCTHSFATREVRNLRYLPSSGFRLSRSFIPSVFCFEVDDKTLRFASGVTDIEAFALIHRMLDVYDFPKDRALEYIGIRQ